MTQDVLREMRRKQAVRVANASRGHRDRELAYYRQLDALCSDPLDVPSPKELPRLTATLAEYAGEELPF
jgi:hypothetical protein